MTSPITPRRSRLLLAATLVAVAVTALGCGASHKSATTNSASATSAAATTPAAAATPAGAKLPLNAYLVRGHEETGMQPTGRATVYRTAAQWTSNGTPNAAAEDQRLAQEGFRDVTSVQTSQGVSWAMELGSAAAAAREKAAELHEFAYGPGAPTTTTRFTIPGIPSADGWVFPNADANVLFTEGRCLMLVGDDLTTTDNKLPVVAAAHAIWARTHASPGACAT
jgi:hypothetical protein